MFLPKSWRFYIIIIAVICAGAWGLAEAALPTSRPSHQGLSQATSSGVFTPAHSSVMAAIKDYFGWRPTPVQPIAFPHNVHIAKGLPCELCHTGVATGPDATIPSVKLCMACHTTIAKNNPVVKQVAAYYKRGQDIPWVRVYSYSPEAHLKFNHAPHIRAKIACATCHGDMSKQTTAVREVNLTMGRCVDCHRQRKVSVDCTTCHY